MRIADHPSRYKSCFEPERMLNKPGLLVRHTTCAELEWRLVKEFWSGDDKIDDAYGIDRLIDQKQKQILDARALRI